MAGPVVAGGAGLAGAGAKSNALANLANFITAFSTTGDFAMDAIRGGKQQDVGARTGYILGGNFIDKQFGAEQLNSFLRSLGLNVKEISADDRINRAIDFQNAQGEDINRRELERMSLTGSINRDLARIQQQGAVQRQNVQSLGALQQQVEQRNATLGQAFLNNVLSQNAQLARDYVRTPLESRSRAGLDTP